jgi:hypothetical protein
MPEATASPVPEGTHHVLVTAPQAESEIVTVDVREQGGRRYDFAMQVWDDPAANLTAETLEELDETAPQRRFDR